MGDMADDAMFEGIREQAAYDAAVHHADELAKKNWDLYITGILYWTTKNSKEILVQDMETSHVTNSLNMIKRRPSKDDGCEAYSMMWIKILDIELKKRAIEE